MCYHTAHPGKGELKKQFQSKKVDYDQREIFHVSGFARPYLPVTLGVEPEAIVSARWKLIPFWVKDETGCNLNMETARSRFLAVYRKAVFETHA